MTTTADEQSHIVFIELLRGVACLLVVWDHLVAIWNDTHQHAFLPLTLVREYVTKPLGIIQDFGYLGVAIFFFVSGFIITHVAQREDRIGFTIKRVFRIYPPLIVSIVIIIATTRLYTRFVDSRAYSDIGGLGWPHILFAMTLWNYFFNPQYIVNGVAWSLVIEEIFYAMTLLLMPWLRSRPRLATITCSVAVFAFIWFGKSFGTSFFLFAASAISLPLLLIGQITYFLWRGRLRWYEFTALLLVNYALFIYGIRVINPAFYDIANSRAISALYAYGVFVLCLLLNSAIAIPRILKFYSKISYSMYLNHGSNGLLLISVLYLSIGYVTSLGIALAAVTGLSYLSWRCIERPGQRAARALIARWQQVQDARAQAQHASAAQ